MDFLLCVCLLISLGVAREHVRDRLITTIKNGQIKGRHFKTRGGRTVEGYLGIPYAKPPIGKLRFRPPHSPMPWTGVRDGTKDRSPCVQNNLWNYKQRNITFGNEDCLYLNVFTPKSFKGARLSVMVYFHGGGFFSGSSSSKTYGPDYLLDFDVILVVINYRLGPLGFLSTEDKYLPGNYGLKDQRQALYWVKNNIENFGGNSSAVTIFGNGAGAASVHLHMLSPSSTGLFQAAIAQSGSALCQWAVNPPGYSAKVAHRVAKQFRCPTTNSKVIAECLRKVPANNLTSVIYKYLEFDVDPTVIFAPTIESISMDAVITEDPWTMSTSVPWMVGIVSEEGAMRVSSLTRGEKGAARVDKLNNEFKHILPKSLMLEKHSENSANLAKQVVNFYFHGDGIIRGNLFELITMYSDARYAYCTLEAVRRHYGPVYQYYFAYKGNKTLCSFYGNDKDDLGVCHGDELIYLFPMHDKFRYRMDTKEDIEFSLKLVELWTNFAHFRCPTLSRNLRNSFTLWMAANRRDKVYLDISDKGYSMKSYCIPNRLNFWHNLNFRTIERNIYS